MMIRSLTRTLRLIVLGTLCFAPPALAEQMQRFGAWQFHYIVLPTTFLQPQTAQEYDIVRGKDRALINVSLIHDEHGPAAAKIAGDYTNLLSQTRPLKFREVREGDAIYYLAELKHTDRDILRFAINALPEGQDAPDTAFEVKVQQRMYVERHRQ